VVLISIANGFVCLVLSSAVAIIANSGLVYLPYCTIHQVFEGTSGIDNKFTTVQFTGEV